MLLEIGLNVVVIQMKTFPNLKQDGGFFSCNSLKNGDTQRPKFKLTRCNTHATIFYGNNSNQVLEFVRNLCEIQGVHRHDTN